MAALEPRVHVGVASYRVSNAFLELAERAVGGELELLDVSSLRRLRLPALVHALREHRGRPFALLLEDEASAALLPVLILLGVVAGASELTVVQSDGRTSRIGKRKVLRATLSLAVATLAVRRAARQAAAETKELIAAPRASRRLSAAPGVLYVNANLWFGLKAGGSVGHVAGVVNALLDAGLDVDVAAVARQPLVDERAGFVELSPPRSFGIPPELNQYRFSISAANRLRRHLDPARHRFVYQRLSLGNYTGAQLARATGLPLVLEYNGSEVWVARHWGRPLANEALAVAAEDASLRQADLVVTVSDVLRDELLGRGVEPARLVTFPNGVDPGTFDPGRNRDAAERVRAELGIPRDAVVVAFLGTFGKWHGTEVFAQAIQDLAADGRWLGEHDVRFVFVGDGLQMPVVREMLEGVAADRVTFAGLVPQARAPEFLAASDVVVSPHVPNADGSPFFGSPTKLFEYMAMALPIVASELDQIGDVLQPSVRAADLPESTGPAGSVAVLTTPGSTEELAAGIRWLAEREDWRHALGANARSLALRRHTWAAHVGAILERLGEVGGASDGDGGGHQDLAPGRQQA